MKKEYETMRLRVWRYSEDIVRTSNPVAVRASVNNFSADNGKLTFGGDAFEESEFTCSW